jgi:hypothetical protein
VRPIKVIAYITHLINILLNLTVFRLSESVPVTLARRLRPWQPTTGFIGKVIITIAIVTQNVKKFVNN